MASVVVAGGGLAGYGCTKPVQQIRWAMGWILWREYRNASIPLSEAIQNLSDLGLDGIEFTPRQNDLERQGLTPESFRDLLAEKKLSIAGNYVGADFHNPEKRAEILTTFRQTLANLQFYGAKNVVIGPPGRGNEADIPDKIKAMAPFLNELGKIAQDAGMEIGIHPHVNTIVENPTEIDMIMELTDPRYVGMAPDTGHIDLGGGNSLEIIRKYSSRLNYFHLKDVTGNFTRPNFSPNLRELGKGAVDFPAIMTFLKEIKFSGWLNVEQDTTELTPSESAKLSMNYINTKLKPIYT